ncbi:hypothetical protein AND_009457 [Anopheles darlingi]|uniref:Secreted protein n=1 Tax=Anopheles darlingi TaxID=43151 RepID=W5J845_ANODA|nr:hypothetical protein AND_009457 [Anopheles darlingi]
MNKVFCFAFLLVACLASFAAAQAQVYTREIRCSSPDFDSCLCIDMPKAIAAAKGGKATATLFNPATQKNVVVDLSRPLSGDLREYCAKVAAKAKAAAAAKVAPKTAPKGKSALPL